MCLILTKQQSKILIVRIWTQLHAFWEISTQICIWAFKLARLFLIVYQFNYVFTLHHSFYNQQPTVNF